MPDIVVLYVMLFADNVDDIFEMLAYMLHLYLILSLCRYFSVSWIKVSMMIEVITFLKSTPDIACFWNCTSLSLSKLIMTFVKMLCISQFNSKFLF